MTPTELKAAILDIINYRLGGEIKDQYLHIDNMYDDAGNVIGHAVGIEDHQYRPSWFSSTLPDEEFLEAFSQWLRVSHIKTVKNWRTERNTTTFRQNPFVE